MLVGKPEFPEVAQRLNIWFTEHTRGGRTGVLVSHNTPVDIQFLLSEYLRAEIELPPAIKLGLDTLQTLRRFSSLCYRKVSPSDWPELTSKGKLSMGVKPCAIYALSQMEPPQSFATACGEHHDADADTRAVAVILFDKRQFGTRGLYHCVFASKKKCFQPIEEVRSAMRIKLKECVVEMEPLPPGWVASPVGNINIPCLLITHSCVYTFDSSKMKTIRFLQAATSCPHACPRLRKRRFVLLVTNVGKDNPPRS